MNFRRVHRRRELADRRQIIEDPESAALSGGDEIRVMDGQVGNRDDREVQLQGLPGRADIKGYEHTGLRSRVQQASLYRILAHHTDERRVRNAAADDGPRRAIVSSLIDVWLEVVQLIPGRRHV